MEEFQKLCCLKLPEKRIFRKILCIILYMMDTCHCTSVPKIHMKGNVKYGVGLGGFMLCQCSFIDRNKCCTSVQCRELILRKLCKSGTRSMW